MKKKICIITIIVLLNLLALFATAIPIFAIANPDAITLHTAKFFEDIFEDDDMLLMVSYDVDYAAEPTEPASEAFLVSWLDTDGTTLLLSRSLNCYQYNVISIYATAAQVTSLALVANSEYVIRVGGNPALFGSLVENTNMDTVTVSAGDWNADNGLTALELLRLHCIDIAAALEDDWPVTLLVTTSTGSQVLNSTGTVTFLDAVPNLNAALPELFQLSSNVPTVPPAVADADYAVESALSTRLGADIGAAFTGIGTFLGIGQNASGGLWALVFILTIASIAFLNTGNSTAAIVLAVPAIVLMTYVGAIPEAVTYVIAIFVAVYAMYFMWLRGT